MKMVESGEWIRSDKILYFECSRKFKVLGEMLIRLQRIIKIRLVTFGTFTKRI